MRERPLLGRGVLLWEITLSCILITSVAQASRQTSAGTNHEGIQTTQNFLDDTAGARMLLSGGMQASHSGSGTGLHRARVLLQTAGGATQCSGQLYTIRPGDTLNQLAMSCNSNVSNIMNDNPQITDANRINVGEQLCLPSTCSGRNNTSSPLEAPSPAESATSMVPSPSGGPCSGQLYTVKPGDTLNDLASSCDSNVSNIMNDNPQITDPNRINVGDQLCLPITCSAKSPEATPPMVTTVSPAPSPSGGNCQEQLYTIQPGDTLSKLVTMCPTDVQRILEDNPQITASNNIVVGDQVCLPATCSQELLGGGSSQTSSTVPSGSSPVSTDSTTHSSSLSGGAIAGIVVGAILGVALANTILVLLYCKKRRARNRQIDEEANKPVPKVGPHTSDESSHKVDITEHRSDSVETIEYTTLLPDNRQQEFERSDISTIPYGSVPYSSSQPADTSDLLTIPYSSATTPTSKPAESSQVLAVPYSTARISPSKATESIDIETVPYSNDTRSMDVVEMEDVTLPDGSAVTESFKSLPAHWEIPVSDVKLASGRDKRVALGRGGYGVVHRAVVRNRNAAIKIVRGGNNQERARLLYELKALEMVKTDHIIHFLGYCLYQDDLLLCMEYVSGGSLYASLGRNDEFQWYNRGRQAVRDIAAGLLSLHELDYAHLNLKSANVLIGSDRKVKIADFGTGKLVQGNKQIDLCLDTETTQQEAIAWTAPEMLLLGDCALKSDVWSFGTILWEVCTLRRPQYSMRVEDIKVPDEAPQELVRLIRHCRAEKFVSRPTMGEVCERLDAIPHES